MLRIEKESKKKKGKKFELVLGAQVLWLTHSVGSIYDFF